MYAIGEGSRTHPVAGGLGGKEEASMREEWMERVGEVRVPRTAMNKLVMNYLVTEGFKDAAERFQEEAGVAAGQHLIELIREQKVEEALKFAAEHLAERGEEDAAVLQELERTLALLAFEDPESCPFADLLAPAHRQQVASELNAAILRAEHTESSQSKLAIMLERLLWAQVATPDTCHLTPSTCPPATSPADMSGGRQIRHFRHLLLNSRHFGIFGGDSAFSAFFL